MACHAVELNHTDKKNIRIYFLNKRKLCLALRHLAKILNVHSIIKLWNGELIHCK